MLLGISLHINAQSRYDTSFLQSKRMSDADFAKKKEGTFKNIFKIKRTLLWQKNPLSY